MIWLLLAIFTLGTLLYMCTPLYRSQPPAVVEEDIEAYRAETQNTASEDSLNLKRQLLTRLKPKAVQNTIPKAWLATVFSGSFILSVFLYFSLGSPQWATSDVQREQPQVLPALEVDAITKMSPEDRAAMITAMVEGLAERLRETPDDIEGWVRLLRSRQVLQQDASEDMALMRASFADQPEIIADILARSDRSPEGAAKP